MKCPVCGLKLELTDVAGVVRHLLMEHREESAKLLGEVGFMSEVTEVYFPPKEVEHGA